MAVRSVVCCDATVRPLGLDVAEVLTEKHVIINRIEKNNCVQKYNRCASKAFDPK